jgi:hypothetical protein
MIPIPQFDPDGLLPAADYEVSFEELRASVLVIGPNELHEHSAWDAPWRAQPVDNLEILTRQLWQAGVRDIFADGSFAEDKDHPNDIDGYFVCTLDQLRTGELVRQLNLLDPYKVLDLGPNLSQTISGISEKTASNVASLSR